MVRSTMICFWAVFLVSLGCSLLFHLATSPCKILFILDSGHYLFTAGGIIEAFRHSGHLAEALLAPSLSASIMLDGPVLPSLAAAVLSIFGAPATGTSWLVVLLVTCICQALTAACLAVLADRLCGDLRAALIVGLAWALYPAALIASGRLLTEPLAVALITALCVLSSELSIGPGIGRRRQIFIGFSAGILAALGFLLKPVLAPLWFALPMYALVIAFQKLRPLPKSLSFLAGLLVIMMPWIIYGYLATGHIYLTPQRVPAHNVAKGHDLTADGWSTDPCSRQTINYEELGSLRTIAKAWVSSPLPMADLYLRKIPRTMAFQWNDFRQKVFGLSVEAQNCWHGIVLALAIFGGLTIILRGPFRDGADGQKRFIANSILAIAIVHALLYLPFEAITRYGFCGVPALFLLAAYGLGQLTGVRRLALLSLVVPAVVMMHSGLVEHFDNPLNLADLSLSTTTLRLIVIGFVVAFMLRWAKSGSIGRIRQIIAVASLLVLLVLPTACLSLHRAEYQGIEISLDANQKLERFFELPANADLIGRSNFLLIDYARCRDLRFAVNGVQLRTPPVSINALDSDYYSLFNLMRMYSAIVDQPVDQMRQWRVIPIDEGLLKVGQTNRLTVQAVQEKVSVYADRVSPGDQFVNLPDRGFSAGYFCNGNVGADMRLPSIEKTAILSGKSAVTNRAGGSELPHFLLPRLYVLSCAAAGSTVGPGAKAPPAAMTTKLPMTDFAPAFHSTSGESLLNINRYSFQLAGPATSERKLPAELSHWPLLKVSLRGLVRAAGRMRKAGVMVTFAAAKGGPFMILPNGSPFVECASAASNQWQPFEISDLVPTDILSGADGKVIVSILPGRWEQLVQYGLDRAVGKFQFKNLELSVEPSLEPIIKGKTQVF